MFLIGFFIYLKNKKNLSANIFFLISIFFSLWVASNVIIWISPDSRVVMFLWSLINIFEISVSLLTLYFSYIFLEGKDLALKFKLLGIIFMSPLIFLSFTNINLKGFDTTICEAVQGPLVYYFYVFESLVFLTLLIYLIKKILKPGLNNRKLTSLFSLGVILFIFSFSGTNIIASLTQNWNILMYGLISAPILVVILVYLIVRFQTFNIKLIATQALVWALVILIGAEFFFIQNNINRILTAITLVISAWLGLTIIRGVKKEIAQKEELAKLNVDLQALIKQRESLVHLVTHKVKGSFTRSKYIFAGMLDGTFGEVTPELKKYAEQGLESDNMGIETVDLVLNVDNLQKGIVKYNMQKVDFREIVEKTIEEKRGPIESKGLKLETSIKDGAYNVMGDPFWLKEVVNNLIENSFKYTKEGTITVCLEDGNSKVKLYVKDTGVGITEDDKKNLFTEGGRGKESVKVNVDSTGYGLYSIKLVMEAHKGRVWAESEGAGKGSTFYVELPSVS